MYRETTQLVTDKELEDILKDIHYTNYINKEQADTPSKVIKFMLEEPYHSVGWLEDNMMMLVGFKYYAVLTEEDFNILDSKAKELRGY